ncbi:MAG: thermonuclease family protein [Planctomycetes bacterium]|nr:thermonuclease family protein [Planctomycetota bacterium]MBU1518536.1 thermonuclease family protein [Planctomycetota bacterium]MBU2457658.1 thermonuclease family protein [Planctomycetota bacterium]MBU2596930.1 thermonuclease family protein [Planctomycetota bacterium]
MKNKNIFLLFVTLTVLSLCTASSYKFNSELPVIENPAFSDAPLCPVVRIIDCGTIIVDINNQEVKIELTGVKPAEKYNKETAVFIENLLKGESVYVVNEPNQKYVYRAPESFFVNAEILRQGYGRADETTPFKYLAEFKQLQEFAKERNKGIWNTADISQSVRTPPAAPVLPKENDITVYVTKTGKKYHLATCSYLSKSSIPIKLKDAKARGYSPCSKCNPP